MSRNGQRWRVQWLKWWSLYPSCLQVSLGITILTRFIVRSKHCTQTHTQEQAPLWDRSIVHFMILHPMYHFHPQPVPFKRTGFILENIVHLFRRPTTIPSGLLSSSSKYGRYFRGCVVWDSLPFLWQNAGGTCSGFQARKILLENLITSGLVWTGYPH